MLVRFIVSNYLSYAEEQEFLMIAGKGLQKNDSHIISTGDNSDLSLLKSSVIYGPNASGKSNLFKAVSTARSMIVSPPATKSQRYPDNRFKSDNSYLAKPTQFEFEFIINNQHFSYGFSYTPERIAEEWLFIIEKSEKEIPVFERSNSKFTINNKLFKGDNLKRLEFMAEDLLENQLFLTMVNNRNIKNMENSGYFTLPFTWFQKKLIILHTNSRFVTWPLIIANSKLKEFMKNLLHDFDTGIIDLDFEEIDTEQFKKGFPETLLEDIFIQLQNNDRVMLFNRNTYQHYIIIKEKETIRALELKTKHKGKDQDAFFSFSEESDGTLRLIDFVPIFLDLNSHVYLIDEFDRSLHTQVLEDFLQAFIQLNHTSQLIVSVHNTNLMHQDLVRRDEIWFVEKDDSGHSHLYSLLEYKPRSDKNLEKGYLAGRYGALPFSRLSEDDYLKEFAK
ncbi:MAG: AAA family ATPase [Spirochaetales bacterium]|nr:AAA family ATPase [Spirochaetales bacterium]